MKILIIALLAVGPLVAAEHRTKRQNYQFPGPREQRSYGAEPVSRQDTYRPPASPRSYSQGDGAYQVPRRQFQAQPVQQYAPAQRPAPRPAAPPPQQYQPPPPPPPSRPPAPRPYIPPQEVPEEPPRRKPAPQYRSSSGRKPSSRPPSQQLSEEYPDEEEEEQRPDALTLLLQDSKFSCSSKKDGYYADNSIGCQVFHYCVGGARHSWMCPEGTRFHQVHLNCVPASQDICGQSEKFHFVNDYLHKPYEGPNNTVLYHQKYYPDGYSIGDPLVAPQQRKQEPQYESQQNYVPQQAQPRPAPRPVEPPPQQYRPAPPPPAYRPAPPPPPPRPAPVYNPEPPSRPQAPAPAYRPPPQPASPPRSVPRSRPSRPLYEESPAFRSRPSGGSDYAEVPRYQHQSAPSRSQPPPPRSQPASRFVPQQDYGRHGNSARVQYDDEY